MSIRTPGKKVYRVTQREVIISVFHIEAKNKREAMRMLSGELSLETSEAMSNGEQETESLETVEITLLEED